MTGRRKKMKKGNVKTENKKSGRFATIAAAVLLVSGVGAGIFSMAAEATARTAVKDVQEVPTSFHVPAEVFIPEAGQSDAENAAEKKQEAVDYHVSMSELNKENPTDIDLTMEEAADIGVKYLEDIMGMDAAGINVYMSYNSGTETFPRPFWDGDVRFGKLELTDDDIWSFSIDAVTGELFTVGYSQTLDVDVPLGYDTSLETNYGVYAEAARELAERHNLVGGPVREVKYGTQGYGGNDPDITMEVYGENGQMAILSFSRYNQRFLGLITDTSRVIADAAMEDLMKEDAEATDWQTETLEDGTVIQWR